MKTLRKNWSKLVGVLSLAGLAIAAIYAALSVFRPDSASLGHCDHKQQSGFINRHQWNEHRPLPNLFY